jgi:hypothetical protein
MHFFLKFQIFYALRIHCCLKKKDLVVIDKVKCQNTTKFSLCFLINVQQFEDSQANSNQFSELPRINSEQRKTDNYNTKK